MRISRPQKITERLLITLMTIGAVLTVGVVVWLEFKGHPLARFSLGTLTGAFTGTGVATLLTAFARRRRRLVAGLLLLLWIGVPLGGIAVVALSSS